MQKNLILSTAIGYKFDQVKFFIQSIRKFYRGPIVFLIGENDHELEIGLKKFDCELIKVNINKKEVQFKDMKYF